MSLLKEQIGEVVSSQTDQFAVMIEVQGFSQLLHSFGAEFVHTFVEHCVKLVSANKMFNEKPVFRFDDNIIISTAASTLTKTDLDAFLSELKYKLAKQMGLDSFLVVFKSSAAVIKKGMPFSNIEFLLKEAIFRTKYEPYFVNQPGEDLASLAKFFARSIENKTITMACQPIVRSGTLRPYAVEMLIRYTGNERPTWHNPECIIDDALKCDALADVTRFIFDEAAKITKELRKIDSRIKVSVNLNAMQMQIPDLTNSMSESFKSHDVPFENVILELTEEYEALNNVGCLLFIKNARIHGFKIALDDLGHGYNNFTLFATNLFDYIKIDRMIAMDITKHNMYKDIINAIYNLCTKHEKTLIIEGIEGHLNHFPQDHNVLYQGYAISKPKPLEKVKDLLQSLNLRQVS